MRHSGIVGWSARSTIALLAIATPLASQQAQDTRFKAAATAVTVDVVVRDQRGYPGTDFRHNRVTTCRAAERIAERPGYGAAMRFEPCGDFGSPQVQRRRVLRAASTSSLLPE